MLIKCVMAQGAKWPCQCAGPAPRRTRRKSKPPASPSQSEGECFDVNPRFCVKAQASSAQDQTPSTQLVSKYTIRWWALPLSHNAPDEQKLAAKPAKELRTDQNQCRRLKDYYGVDRPKRAAERGSLGRIPAECGTGLRFWQRSGSDERPRRISLRRDHLWITAIPKR
jgi:hypothetical protein